MSTEKKARLDDLDVMIENLYEDNLLRKINDATFAKLLNKFENEKNEITEFLDNVGIGLDEEEDEEKRRTVRTAVCLRNGGDRNV